jgi:hypothetical protein
MSSFFAVYNWPPRAHPTDLPDELNVSGIESWRWCHIPVAPSSNDAGLVYCVVVPAPSMTWADDHVELCRFKSNYFRSGVMLVADANVASENAKTRTFKFSNTIFATTILFCLLYVTVSI